MERPEFFHEVVADICIHLLRCEPMDKDYRRGFQPREHQEVRSVMHLIAPLCKSLFEQGSIHMRPIDDDEITDARGSLLNGHVQGLRATVLDGGLAVSHGLLLISFSI